MFELFMYVYPYCNDLSAQFFAVDRALNSYFTIMIMTDHATRSVTIGGIYICSTAMQPKNLQL